MLERIIEVSEALRHGQSQMQGCLHMAMKGCPECRTQQMIASPELGICAECGSSLQVLETGQSS